MKIRSLLLSSAAILIATTSGNAADAVVVEPEPVEYVRICDAYGSGFFYIPGTETCMRNSGYIRSTYEHYTRTTGGIENPNHANWSYRGRLNFDVRNETDWGTLRSQLRFQGNGNGGGDAPVGLDRALISVAGFRLGYSDTYWETAHGSAVNSPAIADGIYDADQALFFDYSFASDGLAVTLGAQDSTGTTADMEAPDYYIGAKYTAAWGWFATTYIQDQNGIDAVTGLTTGADAWKVSTRLSDLGGTGWGFGAWYMADGADASSYVTGDYGAVAALVDNQWGIVLDGALTKTWKGYLLYSAADAIGTSITYIDTNHVAAGLIWAPIKGLKIQFEYYSNESDFVLTTSDTDADAYTVRITRSW